MTSHTMTQLAVEAALSDTQAVWTVTVTNGSGTDTITLAGTQASVWQYAAACAVRGVFGEGAWAPAGIVMSSPLPDGNAPFTAIS